MKELEENDIFHHYRKTRTPKTEEEQCLISRCYYYEKKMFKNTLKVKLLSTTS